jgi:hypothetical protein
MRRVLKPAVALIAAALVAFGLAAPAAADVICTGTIGAEDIDDSVVVPDGASCTLDGTSVDGNVFVGEGASLTARNVTVIGNIQDDNNNAGHVAVTDSRVDGNIQLFQGTSATITDTRIGGDLQLESNRSELRADRNTIGGNLQANQNTGGVAINDNTIDGNLQCQANDPAPTGGGNVVHGSTEDQCAHLTTDGPPPAPPPGPGTARSTSRLAGADRFETAVRIAQRAFPQGAPVVYLARADNFPDALAGSSLTDGPILLVPSCGNVPSVVLAEIRRLDPQQVIALGGEAAICDAVLTAAGNA